MPIIKIEIQEKETKSLNNSANSELQQSIKVFYTDVIAEAKRLETNQNSTGIPEVTGSMIKDATMYVRKGFSKNKKNFLIQVISFFSSLSSMIFGVMWDYDRFKETLYAVFTIIVFILALLSTTFLIFRE